VEAIAASLNRKGAEAPAEVFRHSSISRIPIRILNSRERSGWDAWTNQQDTYTHLKPPDTVSGMHIIPGGGDMQEIFAALFSACMTGVVFA
jgi:hypothetical protein